MSEVLALELRPDYRCPHAKILGKRNSKCKGLEVGRSLAREPVRLGPNEARV